MTGDVEQFSSLTYQNGGNVTFGDNGKGKIIDIGKVHITPTSYIDNVLYVDGLKHNLLSISQFCDKDFKVIFESFMSIVSSLDDNGIKFIGHRHGNIYMVDLDDLPIQKGQCLVAMEAKIDETSWLWHRRLGHASMYLISKLSKRNLVKDLPKLNFEKDKICSACQLGKQTKSSFKPKGVISTSRPLELLHMDLFGPTRTSSLGGKKYGLVIVNDFSRFTWVMFLAHKDEMFSEFIRFYK